VAAATVMTLPALVNRYLPTVLDLGVTTAKAFR
jgi:hypothetical protein